ncbi:MAG TPA: hypothetical protein VI685_19705 [Candidatus Angelobacter sp.]
MPSMLELIKQNAVPAAVMRSAAKGALSLPAPEMLEILVHLTGNKVFGEEAAMSLARWDESSLQAVVSSADASPELLEYFWYEKNRRRGLMPVLIENPRISEQRLIEAAGRAARELVNVMLASRRVHSTKAVLQILFSNTFLTEAEVQQIREELAAISTEPADQELEAAHDVWSREHAEAIKAEEGKAFELIGQDEPEEEAPATAPPEPAAAEVAPVAEKKPVVPAVRETVSILQKLARLNTAGRVKQAFLGNKDERAILIRDGAKIVQNAVLASPKLSDPEVEMFAAAKNVSENVLREIARSRRFLKNYSVIRNLVNNPRCPLDVGLTLVKNLLVSDLKSLRQSKSVSDTVRKMADKLYKDKLEARAQQQS